MPRHQNRVVAALATTFVVAALATACTADSPGPAASSEDSSTPDAADLAARAKALDELAHEYGLAEPPAIEPVHWYDGPEQGPAMVKCLTDAGFSVVVHDGSTDYDVRVSAEQESAFNLADYTCKAKYPLRAVDSSPPSDDVIREIYDYRKDVVAPCLAEHGHTVSSAPSWETFRDSLLAKATVWNPWADVASQSGISGEEFEALEVACPQAPPRS